MTHYDDVIMPTRVRFGATTMPLTKTQIARTASGARITNRKWSQKKRRLRLSYRLSVTDFEDIRDIFEALNGPQHTGLVRDWTDWNTSNNQNHAGDISTLVSATDAPLRNTTTLLYVGNGAVTTFQMVKLYTFGSTASHERVIYKPQNLTVKISVNGVTKTEGVDYTVNYSTGVVTFTVAPPAGQAVKWGGAFYIPFSFASDEALEQTTGEGNYVDANDLELIEEMAE